MYTRVCMSLSLYVYIYIYIHRERERERYHPIISEYNDAAQPTRRSR